MRQTTKELIMTNPIFKRLSNEQRIVTAQAIAQRICQAYQLKNVDELAKRIGIKSETVLDWLDQGEIPLKNIVKCHSDTGLSLDWLVHGIDPHVTVQRSVAEISELTATFENNIQQALQSQLIEEKSDGGIGDLSQKLTYCLFSISTPIIIPTSACN